MDGLWVEVTKAALSDRFEEGTILEMRYGTDDKPPVLSATEQDLFEWRFIPNGAVSDISDPADAKDAVAVEKHVKLTVADKVLDATKLAACIDLCAKSGSAEPVKTKTGAIVEGK